MAAMSACDSDPRLMSVAVTVNVIKKPFTATRLLDIDVVPSRRPTTVGTTCAIDTAFDGKCSICAMPDVN